MYYHMGIIRTGAVIVWRAMIKYFEDLQTIDEFRKLKGKMFENWCYDQALVYGFEPEKIVILNKDRESDDKYNVLLEQIKDFPRQPLILEASFPEGYPNADYREIDLAIRLKHMIYYFECKGTVDPISQEKEIYKWGKTGERHLKLLHSRIDLINFFLDKRGLNHKFFEGATSK